MICSRFLRIIYILVLGVGGFRLLFAVAVIMSHSGSIFGYTLLNGDIAVESFFIISGFYMALILTKKYTGKGSYKLFISNRLLRLYPIYWFILGVAVVLSIITLLWLHHSFLLTTYIQNWNIINIQTKFFLIISNIFIFFQDWILFFDFNPSTGSLVFTWNSKILHPLLGQNFLFIPQAWTIGIELSFYLIAPFIVKLRSRDISLIIIASILIKILLYYLGLFGGPWNYYFFLTELALFLVGILCYRLHENIAINETTFSIIAVNINKKIIYCLVFFLICFTIFYNNIPNWIIPVGCEYWGYLLVFSMALPFLFKLTKDSSLDRSIGELSYPVYISHWLLISLAGYTFGRYVNPDINNIVLILVCIIVSIGLNYFIQSPIDRYRQKRANKGAK